MRNIILYNEKARRREYMLRKIKKKKKDSKMTKEEIQQLIIESEKDDLKNRNKVIKYKK